MKPRTSTTNVLLVSQAVVGVAVIAAAGGPRLAVLATLAAAGALLTCQRSAQALAGAVLTAAAIAVIATGNANSQRLHSDSPPRSKPLSTPSLGTNGHFTSRRRPSRSHVPGGRRYRAQPQRQLRRHTLGAREGATPRN